MIIAIKLRELRKALGITQREVAAAIGVNRRSISFYETGDQDVPNDILPKLAKFYDVTTDYLFGLED